jgi:hypothetical protein
MKKTLIPLAVLSFLALAPGCAPPASPAAPASPVSSAASPTPGAAPAGPPGSQSSVPRPVADPPGGCQANEVIYERNGAVWGCVGGGNWCANSPPLKGGCPK